MAGSLKGMFGAAGGARLAEDMRDGGRDDAQENAQGKVVRGPKSKAPKRKGGLSSLGMFKK